MIDYTRKIQSKTNLFALGDRHCEYLILGNMANDGYSIAKAFWKMNKDVDLAVNSSEFGMVCLNGRMETFLTNNDPYNIHRNEIKNTNVSDRIRYFDFLNKVTRKKEYDRKTMARINLMRMIREYDIVEVHDPYIIYAQFSGIPNVVYDSGWIRYFPYRKDLMINSLEEAIQKQKE